jgi:hypothetical protein
MAACLPDTHAGYIDLEGIPGRVLLQAGSSALPPWRSCRKTHPPSSTSHSPVLFTVCLPGHKAYLHPTAPSRPLTVLLNHTPPILRPTRVKQASDRSAMYYSISSREGHRPSICPPLAGTIGRVLLAPDSTGCWAWTFHRNKVLGPPTT